MEKIQTKQPGSSDSRKTLYLMRNTHLGTLKLELAGQPVWEKCCIPAPPSPSWLTMNYQPRKKSRIVKNGIPPSSSDGLVMTVKSDSVKKRKRPHEHIFKNRLQPYDRPTSNTCNTQQRLKKLQVFLFKHKSALL